MENTPLKPIDFRERRYTRERIVVWIDYFRKHQGEPFSGAIGDLYAFTRYILWLEDRGQPGNLNGDNFWFGFFSGIVLTALSILALEYFLG